VAGIELIRPQWPAPPNVRAIATTRAGGDSGGAFASLNLGSHVGDRSRAVAANRRRLEAEAELPAQPVWLEQVHGTRLVELTGAPVDGAADAAMTAGPGLVCAVLTADCLPVLFCDRAGTRVAAVHAGWRGLAAGILDATIDAFGHAGIAPAELMAWLGPAIGPAAYEVGDDVRNAFSAAADASAFERNDAGRWQCDLYGLARHRLVARGVVTVAGGGFCTHADAPRFFSHRRDGQCGRQATLIWLSPA